MSSRTEDYKRNYFWCPVVDCASGPAQVTQHLQKEHKMDAATATKVIKKKPCQRPLGSGSQTRRPAPVDCNILGYSPRGWPHTLLQLQAPDSLPLCQRTPHAPLLLNKLIHLFLPALLVHWHRLDTSTWVVRS